MSNIKSLQRLLVVQSLYQLSINKDAKNFPIKDIFNQIIERDLDILEISNGYAYKVN